MMTNFVRNFFIIALSLFGIDWLLANISFGYPTGSAFNWEAFEAGLPVLLATTLVLTLLTMIARPILKVLSTPINFLTLGVFNIIIDVFLFWLTAELVDGFSVLPLSVGNIHLGPFFTYVAVSSIFGFLQGCLSLVF